MLTRGEGYEENKISVTEKVTTPQLPPPPKKKQPIPWVKIHKKENKECLTRDTVTAGIWKWTFIANKYLLQFVIAV